MTGFSEEELAAMRAYDAKCEEKPLTREEIAAANRRDREIERQGAAVPSSDLDEQRAYNRTREKKRYQRDRDKRNEQARAYWRNMSPEKKAAMLAKRRADYADNVGGRLDKARAYQRGYCQQMRDEIKTMNDRRAAIKAARDESILRNKRRIQHASSSV